MQHLEQMVTQDGSPYGGREQAHALMATLASSPGHSETLAEVAHDAKNMVSALGLYCDLLEEPGVLATPFHHYGSELRRLAAASRRLVEQLMWLQTAQDTEGIARSGHGSEAAIVLQPGTASQPKRKPLGWASLPPTPIDNLEDELLANRSLLCALAGPSIALTITTAGGGLPVRLTGEDLTRILVNLVKNSAEAMPAGGRILIDLREGAAERGAAPVLLLTIEDNGPGIPPSVLKKLFEPGITTHSKAGVEGNGRSVSLHRGLGLSITRSIVEDAGGQIRAANRDPFGACFQIELPVTMR